MEMQHRHPRLTFWHGVLSVVLLLVFVVIMAAILFPLFSRERRAACSTNRSDFGGAVYEATAKYRQAPQEADSDVLWNTVRAAAAPRMLISTADVGLEVNDVKRTQDRIAGAVAGVRGFVTASGVTGEESSESGYMTVRVPSGSYQSILAKLPTFGKVVSKEEKGEDVTEEYVDLQSRIRNLKREEEAFLKVLSKSQRVPDILAVERELSRVRGNIEQAQGRTQYLQNQVSMATINITLRKPPPPVTQVITWDVGGTAAKSFHALGAIFRAITSVVVWSATFIPLWALIGAVYIGVKRIRARRATG